MKKGWVNDPTMGPLVRVINLIFFKVSPAPERKGWGRTKKYIMKYPENK
jgi:hypothetical protein